MRLCYVCLCIVFLVQSEVTWANFLAARTKHAADAPLSESERLLKEAAMLERDTNVKSSAMGVVPFEITQNVREKLKLLQDDKFDWIAMVTVDTRGCCCCYCYYY